jgi:putative copper resistance protein D
MLIQFVPTLESLYSSRYGQVFILKIALVLLLLLFAVAHKFVLVPRILSREDGAVALRRSIMIETFVGFLILLVTSVVTTAMGPPMLAS